MGQVIKNSDGKINHPPFLNIRHIVGLRSAEKRINMYKDIF